MWASVDAAHGLGVWGSRALEHKFSSLWPTDLVAAQSVGSSWIRDRTFVSCTGRQVLYH